MIKWREIRSGERLVEAFMPEHAHERCEWLLRASCRGHVVEELRRPLAEAPRFGPVSADLPAVEAALDAALERLARRPVPEHHGTYAAAPCEAAVPDADVRVVLESLLRHYVWAEKTLQLTPEQTASYLGLPRGAPASALYPGAITQGRGGRMRKVLALACLFEQAPKVRAHGGELLNALMRDDQPTVQRILADAELR